MFLKLCGGGFTEAEFNRTVFELRISMHTFQNDNVQPYDADALILRNVCKNLTNRT